VFLAVVAVLAVFATNVPTPRANAAPAPINGQGSSYVGLAMQEWVANGQTQGLSVNYLPTGSPAGLTAFNQNLADFAGTEAEFSALQAGDPSRSFQYVPDVAGAVAIMYNISDTAGRKVDYLHLARRTVAKIFTGQITRWNDPEILADNSNTVDLPDQAINVVYRSGQSGTTGLFYDFVANVAPDVFQPWAASNGFPTSVRIIQLDSSPGFAPKTQGFNGSDQIAQYIASPGGAGSIGYDEFGYSKVYGAPSAWIQNANGEWVLPYAANITSALEDAALRPDLSQELSGVYNSARAGAYPISAYSYIVTQCSPAGDRPTCKGNYTNPGIAETLTQWLRYIACEGQVDMADIGYSPLPANLSQEVANSIGRMNGTSPEALNVGNCANPRFDPGYRPPGSPPDPLVEAGVLAAGAGADASGTASTSSAAATGGDELASSAAAGRQGANRSAGGGSGDWRKPEPVAYDRPGLSPSVVVPVLLLLALIAGPPIVVGRRRRSS
jgi:phosphate transport system substrate-binding protein